MHTASDGHLFATMGQMRRYEESLGKLHRNSLADLARAKEDSHKGHVNEHGIATEVTIKREGNGRTRITSKHEDGFKHNSVHPETYRAHDVARDLLGIEPPPAVQTLGRSRAHPTGPKEDERVRREDGREEEEE